MEKKNDKPRNPGRNRFPLLFSCMICTLPLLNCGGGTFDAGGETEAAAKAATPDRDSLRKAYLALSKEKRDTLPRKQTPEAGKLYPVDEAPMDTAFFVFREKLLKAVEAKDIFPLMEAIDEHIKIGSGGENGLAAFARQWELESEERTQQSALWKVLASVLRGGGTFENGRRRFIAPYVSATWPEAYDPLSHAAVTGAGVRMREAPSLNSRILTLVSNDVVVFLGESENPETVDGVTAPWIHVKTLDGTEGYVWGEFILRPADYRAEFQLGEDGQWRMDLLATGDQDR